MAIFINTLGVTLIIFTLWWFLLSKPPALRMAAHAKSIDILVKDGVYEPSQIKIPAHTAVTLRFFRQDPTPCAEVLVFTGINRSYSLPLNKGVEIKLDPQPVGELEFSCQMGMYRGRLVVE